LSAEYGVIETGNVVQHPVLEDLGQGVLPVSMGHRSIPSITDTASRIKNSLETGCPAVGNGLAITPEECGYLNRVVIERAANGKRTISQVPGVVRDNDVHGTLSWKKN